MRLRHRLALVFGLLGLVAVATVSSLAYVLAADEVRGSVDEQLQQRLGPLALTAEATPFDELAPDLELDADGAETTGRIMRDPSLLEAEGDPTSFRVLWDDGTWTGGPTDPSTGEPVDLPPTDAATASLADDGPFFESASVDGRPVRVMTAGSRRDDVPEFEGRTPIGVQLIRDVSSEEDSLDDLALRLGVLSAIAALVVAAAGLIVGRWLARPISELSETAETLAELDDLPRRVEFRRNDELGQMADSYNRLLSAIEVGREQQRRLVADASHELRTPLTGLRMRLEYLQRDDVGDDERRRLLAAAVDDADQLGVLAADLVDLAAAARAEDEPADDVVLGDVIDEVAERVRRRTDRTITVRADDSTASVRPTMLRRALHNLVDNAVKYAADGPVEISCRDGRIEVRDHGPGIAEVDLPHVFDRFFRSPAARDRPGNGIGLAIVRQVAETHDGAVWVRNADDGGAVVGFSVAT